MVFCWREELQRGRRASSKHPFNIRLPPFACQKSFRNNEKVQQTIGRAQTAASVRCERYEVDLVVIEVHPLNAVETR